MVKKNQCLSRKKIMSIDSQKKIDVFEKYYSKLVNKSSVDTPVVTEHFLNLGLNAKNPLYANGILKQVIPGPEESIEEENDFVDDPLCEEKFSPLPKLIHHYRDRALILCTDRCFIRCRFCFRKRFWYADKRDWIIGADEFAKIANYIQERAYIKDVILSGGDPLCMPDKKIFEMVDALDSIESIDVIRIASRCLSAEPSRITYSFAKNIARLSEKVWFISHFNHPAELCDLAKTAISYLRKNGIPILSQTVLLRGINDDASVLADLFRKLVALKVKPHYLFHVDPARGNHVFVTGVEKGLMIMKELRKSLSSICLPDFAIDLPKGGGKIVLSPQLRNGDGEYMNYDGQIFKYF